MGRRLEFSVREQDGRTILDVQGEIDLESSPKLWSGIRDHLSSAGAAGLWVELGAVDYIDSSGIAVLVQGHKHASRAKQVFGLLNPSGKVKSLIELSQLHKLFRIEEQNTDS